MTKKTSFSFENMISITCWKISPIFFNPKGILAYIKVTQGVVKVVFSWSSRWSKIWLYPEYPSNNESLEEPTTLCRIWPIFGSGWLSFSDTLFRLRKYIYKKISPVFFLTGTKIDVQFEKRRGIIIPLVYNLLNYFWIKSIKFRFILLSLWRKGFRSNFKGMVCWIILLSYTLRSEYSNAKTWKTETWMLYSYLSLMGSNILISWPFLASQECQDWGLPLLLHLAALLVSVQHHPDKKSPAKVQDLLEWSCISTTIPSFLLHSFLDHLHKTVHPFVNSQTPLLSARSC